MNRFYIVALVLVLAVLTLGTIFAAARLEAFLDWPSLIMVIVPAAVLSLAAFPPRVIGRSFRSAFVRQEASEADLRQAAAFFRFLERMLLLSGFIAALIGIVAILSQLRRVEAESIGRGFALLLISVFYSLVLILLLAVPFRAAVERRLAEKG
jgi:flagellar motor component MotA